MADNILPSTAPAPLEVLLERWLALSRQGQEVSPEAICAEHPELLPALRQRIEVMENRTVPPLPTHNPSGVETSSHVPGAVPQHPEFLDPPQAADEMGRLAHYRVFEKVGEGGMGTVFQAEDPKLLRLVALKVMRPALAGNPEFRQRFLREARAMAAVEHDHIVAVYQVDEHRGVPFLAMPFLKGEPLQERLLREKKLPALEVMRIGREMALGLAAAHARGLVHRDIKPGNIWLEGERGRVKILDFGLAHVERAGEQALTHTGVAMGTPGFMAPEQVEGQGVDQRSDLFSLGCILYLMATGELAFPGNTMLATLSALATHQPRRPVDLDPQIPAKLSEVIMRLLEKDQVKRKATAEGVAKALEGLLREALQQAAAQRASAKKEAAAAKPGPAAAEAIETPARGEDVSPPAGRGQTVAFAKAEAPQQKEEEPAAKVRPAVAGPREKRELGKKEPSRKKPAGPSRRQVPWLVTAALGMAALMVLLGIIIIVKWKKSPDGSSGVVSLEIKETRGTKPAATLTGEGRKNPARYKNSLGMEFVLVPRGKFFMGGGDNKLGDTEVEIDHDFYLGTYEVTQEEWQSVTMANPSEFSGSGPGKEKVKDIPDAERKRFPVENVSWDSAQFFLKALNAREGEAGWLYRLPKEAEWEYACRGGPRENKFEYGHDFYFEKPTNRLLPEQANCAPEHGKGLQRPCKVGSYKSNSLGLYDMHGNVWEWCDDEVRTPEGASHRVCRGGSWFRVAVGCRAGTRNVHHPSTRSSAHGLRLARVSVGS